MVYTVTLEELDRMFYERIRKAVVAAGYLPDITLYATESAYKAARDALRTTKGQLIDVFGVGSFDARDEKTINKIVIDRTGRSQGSLGGAPERYMVTKSGTGADTMYTQLQYPEMSDTVAYDVRFVGDRTSMERIAMQCIDSALGRRRFLKVYNNSGVEVSKAVLVVNNGDVDLSEKNYMERLFKYVVPDVFIATPLVVRDNIPVMKTVEFTIYTEQENLTNGQINVHG